MIAFHLALCSLLPVTKEAVVWGGCLCNLVGVILYTPSSLWGLSLSFGDLIVGNSRAVVVAMNVNKVKRNVV